MVGTWHQGQEISSLLQQLRNVQHGVEARLPVLVEKGYASLGHQYALAASFSRAFTLKRSSCDILESPHGQN